MSSIGIPSRAILKASATIKPNPVIRALLTIWFLYSVQAAPIGSSPPIKSTEGEKAFNEVIAGDMFSFVKFFHPSCPHCQAMAKDFEKLAFKISDHNVNTGNATNHTIAIIQVDASKKDNDPVLMTHASGFPTLKLFRSGKLIMEYFGPREAKPMYEFLMRALQLADHPLVTHLRTAGQLKEFLKLARDRPIVISLFQPRMGSLLETGTFASDHFPKQVQLSPTEWEETVKTMHEYTAPQTVFATVPHPSLLVPKSSQDRFDWLSSRHSVPPLLAAAPRADDFENSAEWYFPGVRDGAAASSFMHTAVVGSQEFVTLGKHNSPHILETTRPLAIAFGKEDTPSYTEENVLLNAAEQRSIPKLLPVYAGMKYSYDLAEHVGLNVSTMSMGVQDLKKWETQYVIYRFGNRGPVSAIYSDKDHKSVKQWIKLQALDVNGTDVMTFAGEVLELDPRSWRNLFEFDGRGVILELYRSGCASCKNLEKTSIRVARQLQAYAGSIVVARFDTGMFDLPSWPTVPNNTQIPGMIWMAPGEKPAIYDGYRSSRGVARFAMEMSGLRGDRIDWLDVVTSYTLLLGITLTLAGLALTVLSRTRVNKREHIT